MTATEKVEQYLKDNAARFEEELKEILRIPSVSTDAAHKPDMLRCAEKLVHFFQAAGMQEARVVETGGHPAVYAQSEQKPDRPTVLVYGHYDVQPEDPLDEWETPPFEPDIRDGKIFARGTSDDKGQFFVHIKAAEAYHKLGLEYPVNYKFIIEGEEEIGSPSLAPWIASHAELLKSDVLMVSDTTLYAPGVPAVLYGLRGLAYIEVEFKGGDTDMHSGMFGGAVPNPANELCKVIAQLKDDKGRITIPGFYDKVRPLTQGERDAWAKLPFDEEEFRKSVGAPQLCGEEGFTTTERRWARPTLDVNGFCSGFTGEGAKTVLPAKAMAKISCRLVPDQDHEEIAKMMEAEIRRLAPPTVEVKVSFHHGGPAWMNNPDHPINEAARKAYRRAWHAEPVLMREGGSIAIVSDFCNTLHIPAILMGVGLDTDNIHAPNEHLTLSDFHAGIAASAFLAEELAELGSWEK
ncbi:dipeptidase [bacterium]|nr:dipeptidase [bacterium]